LSFLQTSLKIATKGLFWPIGTGLKIYGAGQWLERKALSKVPALAG